MTTPAARGTTLFGREEEQAQLQALLDGARARRSGSLVLIGEPGAGKSALIDDVRASVSDMTVLEAHGVESEAELPFASLHQLLRPTFGLLERLPAAQEAALRSAFALSLDPPFCSARVVRAGTQNDLLSRQDGLCWQPRVLHSGGHPYGDDSAGSLRE